ncbi:hypothetical protein L1987_33231 [Smallanthus sonchifolius]|uniref:Uncharacterized protein n=1 Tax=Smallanthus sonchifolius TaxID=185202 RepID=A0ACB9HRV4_9ASTR|nr:hypothetical protein L1987_33231 [Smallanthus sonchifolius]
MLDLFFPDAPFPCNGKSGVEGIFDPLYFEWFQFNKEYEDYENFDECVEYIEECMIKHAPIDSLLGFSQGAILSAALPGLQAKNTNSLKVCRMFGRKFAVFPLLLQFVRLLFQQCYCSSLGVAGRQ